MNSPERAVEWSAWALARTGAILAACVLTYALTPAMAAGGGPFSALEGVWTGSGTISHQNGKKEGLRCRAQYVVTNDGTNLQQALRCSTDSDAFQVNSYVNLKGVSLSGNWAEVTRNVTGTLSGKADAGKLLITVAAGSVFSAKMTMISTGSSQSVDIKPIILKVKGIDITDLSVKLSR